MSKTLTVYLAADLKRFTGPLNRAERDIRSLDDRVNALGGRLGGMLGPALAGAGLAAGAMAAKFAVDGVQAFIEDQAAAASLAKTLDNLGLSMRTDAVEAHIDALQRQTGVADDVLRPAFERLIRTTHDVEGAQSTLSLAMDIAAGTHKDLDTVVAALGKAYDGNTGALGKLGTGLDTAVLKTKDMRLITAELSTMFAGQATTAASTLQGQLGRLSVGFGELQEAFGAGFAKGMDNANESTGNLTTSMKTLEPTMQDLGETSADTANSLANYLAETVASGKATKKFLEDPSWDTFITAVHAAYEGTDQFSYAIKNSLGPLAFIVDPLKRVADGLWATWEAQNALINLGGGDFETPTNGQTKQWAIYSEAQRDAARAAEHNATAAKQAAAKIRDYSGSSRGAAAEVDILTEALNTQTSTVATLQGLYDEQIAKLTEATGKVKAYSDNLAASLLSGVNLGEAQKVGADLGIGTLRAFDQQIEQYRWFGNVLTEIKRQGGDQALIDQVASLGPAAGGALGQEMIDNGLIKTFSEKLVDVQASAALTASAMVPDFLLAGVDAAQGFVTAAGKQLEAEQTRLKEIGKAIGKPIGNRIKVEIAEAVADAVRAAEAAKTAAAAERAAEAARNNAVVSDQAIAQALVRLIANSNARTGYSMGVPVPGVVLG